MTPWAPAEVEQQRQRAVQIRQSTADLIEFGDEFKILLARLAKTDPWINRNVLLRNAAARGHCDAALQTVGNFTDDVGNGRQAMHGGRCAA